MAVQRTRGVQQILAEWPHAAPVAGLPSSRIIRVEWTRFDLRDAVDPNGEWALFERSVYAIAGANGRPLYIGKAVGKKNPGFGERYWGDGSTMMALAHGTKKLCHVGQMDGKPREKWYEDLERELIAREAWATNGRHPRFNKNFMSTPPNWDISLRHVGERPRFYHAGLV